MGERVHLASKDVGMESAIQDVLNVVKYSEIDEFVLVGHSFAGKVAAAVADRAHEKVKKLIYLDAFRPEKVRTPQGAFDPAGEFGPPPPGVLRSPSRRRSSTASETTSRGEPQMDDVQGDALAGQASQ